MNNIFLRIILLSLGLFAACKATLTVESTTSEPSEGKVIGPDGKTKTIPEDVKSELVNRCEIRSEKISGVPLRILNTEELNHSIKTLFPNISFAPFDLSNRDTAFDGFVRNSSDKISENHLRDFANIATTIALKVSEDVMNGVGCDSSDCAPPTIRALASKAYRSPISSENLARLMDLYSAGADEGGHNEGMHYVVEAILQSPSFIYVFEDQNRAENRLSGTEIAQNLAFMYTQNLPDDELLDAARRGDLFTALGRIEQAKRLISTDLGKDTLRSIVSQWFDLDITKSIQDDKELYAMARSESDRFIGSILNSDRSWSTLLTADYTFVNDTLAEHYGFDISNAEDLGDGWYKYRPDYAAGILTQALFLSVKGTRSVYRGKTIWERVLCGHVPTPPPILKPIETTETESDRSIGNKRLANDGCGSCHVFMEPHAFVFDPFDELGRYQTEDKHGNSLTSDGTILGPQGEVGLQSPKDLAKELSGRREARACLANHIYTWAFPRPRDSADQCGVFDIEYALYSNNGSIRSAMIQIVASPEFIQR